MRYHCRCRIRSCGKRQVLPADPASYAEPPLCVACGKGKLRIDKWAQAKPWNANLCYCGAYEWHDSPHRLGSGRCFNNTELYPPVDPLPLPDGADDEYPF